MSVESPKRSCRAWNARSTSASISAWSSISPSARASSGVMSGGKLAQGCRARTARARVARYAWERTAGGASCREWPRGQVPATGQRRRGATRRRRRAGAGLKGFSTPGRVRELAAAALRPTGVAAAGLRRGMAARAPAGRARARGDRAVGRVRPLLGERAAGLAALGLAVAPYHVSFSDYSRGFTLAALRCDPCLWAAARLATRWAAALVVVLVGRLPGRREASTTRSGSSSRRRAVRRRARVRGATAALGLACSASGSWLPGSRASREGRHEGRPGSTRPHTADALVRVLRRHGVTAGARS